MGGEINQQDNYVVVRQYDAHAWAEVWLPDSGWLRVDPTAAVSPERVDLGFLDAFSNDDDFSIAGSLAAFRHIPLLNSLRMQLDRIDYFWARWVLGYEGGQQQQLLKKWGLLSPWRIAAWGGGGVVMAFILLCFYLYWREWWSLHEHPATRYYRLLCQAYVWHGTERCVAETPLQYARKVADNQLQGAEIFSGLSQQYYGWCYMEDRDKNKLDPEFFVVARRLFLRLWLQHVRAKYFYKS
jgi:hypothetical protein